MLKIMAVCKVLTHNELVNPNEDLNIEIKNYKSELESLYKIKTDGCIIRSRADCVEYGEKNSKYFINLEKRNQKRKVITKLMSEHGDVITGGKEILDEEKTFYQKLYETCNPLDCDLNSILDNIDAPKLDIVIQNKCEGLITISECSDALKNMPNNKTPGTDGFPTEFYKFFYKDIRKNLLDSFNFSFNNGKLSTDQRRGIINLIPKPDKDPTYLKHWRPISLLNTDYKILAKCIASRMKNVLPGIIHND